MARTHIRIDACLRPESLSPLYRFNFSPLLLLPGSLARIIHRRASRFVINKKSDLYIGGAKYFIAPSIALCDCVVYAVNTGDIDRLAPDNAPSLDEQVAHLLNHIAPC